MSVDRRLRRSLEGEAARVEPDTFAALALVEGRVARRQRKTRALSLVAVVAAVVLTVIVVPLALDRAREEPASVEPSSGIRGSYVVEVGDTPAARSEGMVGRWVVSLEPDGVVVLRPPADYPGSISGVAYRVDGDRLRTDALFDRPGCQATGGYVGSYRWTYDGTELSFETVEDSCTARRLLLGGQVWQRLPG